MKQNGQHVSLRKTVLVDVDKKTHKLPPDGGAFSEFKVADYHCPEEWSKDGVFVAVKEGQPMWFDLQDNDECACLVGIQRINPVTGEPVDLKAGLGKDPKQNYLALPQQQWLDGYVRDGKVYQFIVTKEGVGLAVNEFLLPKYLQDSHALAFAFFAPKVPKPRIERTFIPVGGAVTLRHESPIWSLMRSSRSSRWIGGASSMSSGPHGLSAGFDDPTTVDNLSKNIKAEGGTSCFVASVSSTPAAEGKSKEPGSSIMDFDGASMDHEEVVHSEEFTRGEVVVDNASMGMGGRIKQRIVTDDNTTDYYLDKPVGVLTIYLALPGRFKEIMDKGKRQDANKNDKFVHSGEVGGVQVPLIGKADM